MAGAAKPNRRGDRSRELVLDAAERIMAAEGYAAAALSRIVDESQVPVSSVYHHFGSKDGVLRAVMERGAERFFAGLPEPDGLIGDPPTHLSWLVETICGALERQPHFLRLAVAMAAQPPLDERREALDVVCRVRELALVRLRRQLGIVFGASAESRTVQDLARFALAAFDGAFIAWQAEPELGLQPVLQHLPAALLAAREPGSR